MKILKLFTLAASALLLCNCGSDPVPGPTPEPKTPVEEAAYVKLGSGQSSSVSTGYDKTDITLSFSTNKSWTAEVSFGASSSGWVSLNSRSGTAGSQTIIATVSENSESVQRSAVITIKAGSASATITISQEAFKSEFSISPKAIEVAAEGGTVEVSVTSNIGYHASTSVDWIHEMSTKATETKSLWFTVDANETSEPRSAVIVICNDNEVCIPVTVNQDGQPAEDIFLELGAYTLDFDHQERCSQVKVTSNDSWSAVSSASWCTVQEIASGGFLEVCVKANDTGKSRTAQITVKTKSGGLEKTITVSQSTPEANEGFGDDGEIKWD